MKVKELNAGIKRILIACETAFYNSDMTSDEQAHKENIDWILNSDTNDIEDILNHYAEMIESELC